MRGITPIGAIRVDIKLYVTSWTSGRLSVDCYAFKWQLNHDNLSYDCQEYTALVAMVFSSAAWLVLVQRSVVGVGDRRLELVIDRVHQSSWG